MYLITLPALLIATACAPTIDFDLDLEPGPVVGERGAVTFSLVDGCPDSDPFFGCPKTLPGFAVGSQARFIIGSVTGDTGDEQRLRNAKPRSLDREIASASRDADGLLYIDSFAEGDTTIEIIEDGETLDTINVYVDRIMRLDAGDSATPPYHLVGTVFPAEVNAYGSSGQRVFAHGAIAARAINGLALDAEHFDYFTGSESFAVTSNTPGYGELDVWTDTVSSSVRFEMVTRDEITEVTIEELFPTPDANKVTLIASARIDGRLVAGGPACDWRVVTGGGPGVVLSPKVGDAFTTSLFVLYTSAIVFGSGATVVECRANDRVVVQHTIQFAQT